MHFVLLCVEKQNTKSKNIQRTHHARLLPYMLPRHPHIVRPVNIVNHHNCFIRYFRHYHIKVAVQSLRGMIGINKHEIECWNFFKKQRQSIIDIILNDLDILNTEFIKIFGCYFCKLRTTFECITLC